MDHVPGEYYRHCGATGVYASPALQSLSERSRDVYGGSGQLDLGENAACSVLSSTKKTSMGGTEKSAVTPGDGSTCGYTDAANRHR